jgi:prepilin-type N-terminal cleavage/methylation domain-containing protein
MRANQKGFTLIEMIISVALIGMLSAVLITAVFQIQNVTEDTTDRTTGNIQVQIAGRWFSRDVKKAADTTPGDGAPATDTLTLQWEDQYEDAYVEHTVQYYLSGAELKRDYDGVVTTVARYISDVDFSRSGSVVTMDIIATSDGTIENSEEGTYRVTLRI